jgi:hypothetical protein
VNDIGGNRVVGLDLGVTSAHSAVVLDVTGQVLLRRRVVSTVDSLAELEQAALQGAPEQTRLTVVIEPTGPMWLPIAVYFGRGGHTVVRVSSTKAADLRRFLSRHAKSNGIDAETLARLPMVAPAGLHPVELSGTDRASLDRRVRTVARLTREIGQRKVRIRALAQTLIPLSEKRSVMGSTALIWPCWNGMPTPELCWGPGEHDCCDRCAPKAAANSVMTKYEPCAPPLSRHSNCGATTPLSRYPTSPRRSPPRSDYCAWPRPNAPATKQPETPH